MKPNRSNHSSSVREARGGGGKGRILYIHRYIYILDAPLFGKMENFLRLLCYTAERKDSEVKKKNNY